MENDDFKNHPVLRNPLNDATQRSKPFFRIFSSDFGILGRVLKDIFDNLEERDFPFRLAKLNQE
jgi:hypothetical protein